MSKPKANISWLFTPNQMNTSGNQRVEMWMVPLSGAFNSPHSKCLPFDPILSTLLVHRFNTHARDISTWKQIIFPLDEIWVSVWTVGDHVSYAKKKEVMGLAEVTHTDNNRKYRCSNTVRATRRLNPEYTVNHLLFHSVNIKRRLSQTTHSWDHHTLCLLRSKCLDYRTGKELWLSEIMDREKGNVKQLIMGNENSR